MKPTHRTLMWMKVTNLDTGITKHHYVDAFAVWEDIGNGKLQPTKSTQSTRGLHQLKEGMALRTSGYRYERLNNITYCLNTSMNNEAIRL